MYNNLPKEKRYPELITRDRLGCCRDRSLVEEERGWLEKEMNERLERIRKKIGEMNLALAPKKSVAMVVPRKF